LPHASDLYYFLKEDGSFSEGADVSPDQCNQANESAGTDPTFQCSEYQLVFS